MISISQRIRTFFWTRRRGLAILDLSTLFFPGFVPLSVVVINTPRVCTTLPVLTALPMPNSSPTPIPNPINQPTPKPIKPRFCSQAEPAPLPISKLPPLRPPSASFQVIGAEMSWSEISRSCIDQSRNKPHDESHTEQSVASPEPHSVAATPSMPPMPPSSSLNSMPQPDSRLRSVLNPPISGSLSQPTPPTSPQSTSPQSTSPQPTQNPFPNVELIGGLNSGIDRDIRNEIAQHVAPVRAGQETVARDVAQNIETPLTHRTPVVRQPSRRRRPTSSPLASRLTSWLNLRSAPVVYAASIALGLLAFGALSKVDDRPSQGLADTDCAGAILVDATLTPEALAQIPAKIGQARANVAQLIGSPYCSLPKVSVRYGAIAERDVYRMADERRVVVSYEDGMLLGVGVETLRTERPAWQAGVSPSQMAKDSTPNDANDLSTETNAVTTPPASDEGRLQEVKVQQSWGVQIGDAIGTAEVIGSLGDVSLAHRGRVFAPVDGWVEGNFVTIVGDELLPSEPDCVLFSSPQLPSYLMKTCGLVQRYFGAVEAGQPIGRTGGALHVSLLSRRRDQAANSDAEAEWVYVSPSPEFLAQAIDGEE